MTKSDLDNIAYSKFANGEITLAEYIKYINRDKIMDIYEQKYKEALERAQKAVYKGQVSQNFVDDIFPELVESEDERIRKTLIAFFRDWERTKSHCWNVNVSDILTWLEKQREYVYRPFAGSTIEDAAEKAQALGDKIILAFNGAYIPVKGKTTNEIVAEYYNWLKNQSKKSITIDINKMVSEYSTTEDGDFGFPINCMIRAYKKGIEDVLKLKQDNPYGQRKECEDCQFNYAGECKGYCALRREHKPTDKVEPKFKVGDWVVKQNGENFWNGDCVAQIIDITDCDKYWLNIDCWVRARDIRLWTIQDAKDGDVLAVKSMDGYPFPFVAIYKEHGLNFFNSYCYISFEGKFYKSESGHSTENIYLATKEQRDLLFEKMKEAGYEWDADKKELRKIEPKMLDADKVIAWMENSLPKYGNFSVANKFIKDFGLC